MIAFWILFAVSLVATIYGYYLFFTKNLEGNLGKIIGTFVLSLVIIVITKGQTFREMDIGFWGLWAAYCVHMVFAVWNIARLGRRRRK